MAPFEHVHPGHEDGSDHHGLIHAHFFAAHVAPKALEGPGFDDVDDDHAAAWQVDTFTLVLPAVWVPFVPSRGPVFDSPLAVVAMAVIPVEERGHDPPAIAHFPPRAPPV